MNRRKFIKWSAISFCASQIFSPVRFLFAEKVEELTPEQVLDPTTRKGAFQKNMKKNPWLKGFEGVKKFSFRRGHRKTGSIPPNLNGVFYRMGPGWLSDDKDRFNHWLEGEGLAQSITIKNRNIVHRAEIVKTPQMIRWRLQDNRSYSTLATKNEGAKQMYFPPNQSVLALKKDRLLALADGAFSPKAKPWEIDRETLRATDYSVTNRNDIALRALSSHPIKDHDKSIWSAIPDFRKRGVILEQYFSTGKLYKKAFFPLKEIGYFHSFVVTKNKIVIVVPPLFFSNKITKDYLSSFFWSKEAPCSVLVIDKKSFSLDFMVKTPAFFAMHFINGFERYGKIVVDGLCYENGDILLHAYRDLMKGQWCRDKDQQDFYFPRLKRFTVTKDGVIQKLMSKHHYEMPSIDPRDLGKNYSTVVLLKKKQRDKLSGGALYYRSVTIRDMKISWENSYRYPNYYFPEEHIYIPDKKKSSGKGGWVLGSVYDFKKKRTRIFIFDAEKINKGPIMSALLAYALPTTAHGEYVPDF